MNVSCAPCGGWPQLPMKTAKTSPKFSETLSRLYALSGSYGKALVGALLVRQHGLVDSIRPPLKPFSPWALAATPRWVRWFYRLDMFIWRIKNGLYHWSEAPKLLENLVYETSSR